MDQIVVSGAREHNLKDVDVAIPRDSLTVITGLSGSGKSSLAFDTIYAEGQRRYVESLSAYARQFLGQMDKPDVDSIEGLSPAISIDQKTTSRNPRSTVGTVTEIYDYLRLLWARIGHPHCHICGRPITGQSAEQIIDQVMELGEGTRFMVMAPIVRGRKGEYGKQFEELRTEGFGRVKVNGELRRLDEEIVLDKKYKHDISVVVDRLVMKTDLRKRLADSIETAVTLADGLVEIEMVDASADAPKPERILTFSERFACPVHGPSLVELEPRIFSFNAPHGACPRCTGLGSQMEIDPELVVPDPTLSIGDGAIAPWAASASQLLRAADAGDLRALRRRPRHALAGPARRGARVLPERHQGRARPGLLPQPVRPPAHLRDPVRGDHPEPRASLPRDRLRLLAREDRGVHDAAAVPGLQGRPAAARVPRGARLGHADPRVHGAAGAAGPGRGCEARAVRARPPDRAAGAARDRGAPAVPGQRRRRLPVDGPRRGDAVGRRGPADPAGDPDRLLAGRGAVHPRRAVDRAAPARQREADRDARAAAQPRQHGARGRARRGDDARRRPHRRHGPGRRRARRPRRRRGTGRRGRRGRRAR